MTTGAAASFVATAWQDAARLSFVLGGRLGREPPLYSPIGRKHDLYMSHSEADASFAGEV